MRKDISGKYGIACQATFYSDLRGITVKWLKEFRKKHGFILVREGKLLVAYKFYDRNLYPVK